MMLHQHTTQSLVRGITVNLIWLVFLRQSQNWCGGLLFIPLLVAFFAVLRPSEWLVLSSQLCQGSRDLGKPFNEASIVSSQPKETPYLCHRLRPFPSPHSLHFTWIYGYAFPRDDMPEKLYFL